MGFHWLLSVPRLRKIAISNNNFFVLHIYSTTKDMNKLKVKKHLQNACEDVIHTASR